MLILTELFGTLMASCGAFKVRLRVVLVCLLIVSFSLGANAVELTALERCKPLMEIGLDSLIHSNTSSSSLLGQARSDYVLLDQGINHFRGWSHVDTDTAEFSKLHGRTEDYAVTAQNYVPNSHCEKTSSFNVRLVAKLSDWQRQHANGMEASIDHGALRFGELKHLVLELGVVTDQTHILSTEQLGQIYADFLNSEQALELDRGQINLQITLFERGAEDQSTRSLNASAIVSLQEILPLDMAKANPESDAEFESDTKSSEQGRSTSDVRWVRVMVPINDFDFFYEQNYAKKEAKVADVADNHVAGIRITTETENGKQLRNLLGEKWSEAVPENFKEVGLQFSRVVLTR